MKPTYLAIVEDDTSLAEQIARFFNQQPDLCCCLVTGSIAHLFDALLPVREMDVLLLDIMLGEDDSMRHLFKIKRLFPDTKIIIFTGCEVPELLVQGLRHGADSFVLKGTPPDRLLEIIRLTIQGGAYLEPRLASIIHSYFQKQPEAALDLSPGYPGLFNNYTGLKTGG